MADKYVLIKILVCSAVYWFGFAQGYHNGRESITTVPLAKLAKEERMYAAYVFWKLAEDWKLREASLEGDKRIMHKVCREQLESTVQSLETDK
jgi:hypothetical protein